MKGPSKAEVEQRAREASLSLNARKASKKAEVERVARLLHDAFLDYMKDLARETGEEKVTVPFEDLSKRNREKYLHVARAVIRDFAKKPVS